MCMNKFGLNCCVFRLLKKTVNLDSKTKLDALLKTLLLQCKLMRYLIVEMPLNKPCSSCGSQVHVRKIACPCGHQLRTREALLKSDEQSRERRSVNRDGQSLKRSLESEEETASHNEFHRV